MDIKTMQDWEQAYLKKPEMLPNVSVSVTNKSNSSSTSNSSSNSEDIILKKPSIDFQKSLQQARLAQKMTQKDLALKSGIQLNSIQNYENGKEIPSNLIISKLEKLLNTKLPRIYKIKN